MNSNQIEIKIISCQVNDFRRTWLSLAFLPRELTMSWLRTCRLSTASRGGRRARLVDTLHAQRL